MKILRAQNSSRKSHEDRAFAKSVFEMTEEFANLFEPDYVCYISQDDKAKVPIDLPISKKQTALLMHVEYKVILISIYLSLCSYN